MHVPGAGADSHGTATTVRPAVLGDAPAICELLDAIDVMEIGRPETDLGTVETELRRSTSRTAWRCASPSTPGR
ncbi:hypothetical protein [Streptomyces sp. NPDC001070]